MGYYDEPSVFQNSRRLDILVLTLSPFRKNDTPEFSQKPPNSPLIP